MKTTIKVLVFIALVATICACTSCAATGYGCHGRSKIMTRVR